MSAYVAKTEVFEGPLHLLLELVSERKLFINEVSLAQVTDDFIAYIEKQQDFPLSESAEFILVASTLMLVKSRSLLPSLPLTIEEQICIHELENRLAIYAKIKELSQNLKMLFGKRIIFEKEAKRIERVVFAPDDKTTREELSTALERVIATLPKLEQLPKVVVKKVISLEQMIERLVERISKASSLNFKDLHRSKDKVSIIVGFLAVLELVKRGVIKAEQEGSNIQIESQEISTPTYA